MTKSLDRLEGDLKGVDGLAEVKEVLVSQKENLYSLFVEDLSKQLFTESTWEVLQMRRNDQNPFQRSGSNQGSRGSTRGGNFSNPGSGRKRQENDSSRPGSGRKVVSAGDHIRVRKLLQLNSDSQQARQAVKMMTLLQEEEFQNILKNPKLASLSEGPMHVIVINIECLALLNQLPNAIEAVKSDLLNELQSIGNLKDTSKLLKKKSWEIRETLFTFSLLSFWRDFSQNIENRSFLLVSVSTQILQENSQYPVGDERLLPELFTAVVEQFQLVVDAFRVMLQCLAMSVDRNRCDSVKFDIAEVWARVQSVMQMMLTDYLDFKAKNSLHQPSSASDANASNASSSAATTADINSFFVRRKTQRPKRDSLFRFDYR